MRRKSERRKSTDVASPVPHSTRRTSRRRTSSSADPGPKETLQDDQVQDKVSSKEIEREDVDNKKDPRDSNTDHSDGEERNSVSSRSSRRATNKVQAVSKSPATRGGSTKRGKIDTIAEENGNIDEEDKIESKVEDANKESETNEESTNIEDNQKEDIEQKPEKEEGEMDTESEPEDRTEKTNLKAENIRSTKEIIRIEIKSSEKPKIEEVNKTLPKAPRRRRFDERPEDVALNKQKEIERQCSNGKVTDTEDVLRTTEIDKQNIISTPNVIKKRRWLSQKSSEFTKPKVLAITTDSLKDLISDVCPVPLSDVKLESSPEPEEIPILEEKIHLDMDDDEVDDHEKRKREHKSAKEKDRSKNRDRDRGRDRDSSKDKRTSKDKDKDRSSHSDRDSKRDNKRSEETSVIGTNRKISIINEEEKQAMALARPPSPPKNASSTILYITNLVRPFTVLQLKGLLVRTGKIVENGFWIDRIKSKCFVQYENEDEAVETRHALHGVRWPPSNPKCLNVDFGTSSAMQKAIVSTSEEISKFQNEGSRENRTIVGTGWEKERYDYEDRKNVQVNRPIREWDVGKKEEFEREGRRNRDRERDRSIDRQRGGGERDRDRDRERIRDRDRDMDRERRRFSADRENRDRRRSESGTPVRKYKRKENDPPIRLLDDLFRKTKTTPCIYWLPLTPEQIAEKEEVRRKRIQENEVMRKEREKERERRDKERERERERRREKSNERSNDRERRHTRSKDRRRY